MNENLKKTRKALLTQLLKWSIACLIIASMILGSSHFVPVSKGATNFPNCRLGVGGVGVNFADYSLDQLNVGLFSNWWATNASLTGLPDDVEYIQTVRLHQDKVGSSWHGGGAYVDPPSYSTGPSLTEIAQIAAAQPGSRWVLGNEPDKVDFFSSGSWRGQDEITPELYAVAFHEIRSTIKAADPTAQIGIGSVIQGTPLRLKYLDKIWEAYESEYSQDIGDHIDFFTVHGFILREEDGTAGARIPPGLVEGVDEDYVATDGFLYGENNNTLRIEHQNIDNFDTFTRNLRQWMADKGLRNKPLINTEFGILYKDSIITGSISDGEVVDYLKEAFDYILTETDDDIGYPRDENRLIQGAVWYSLNDDNWNGRLFDDDFDPTTIGQGWIDYVTDEAKPLASEPRPNMWSTGLNATPSNPTTIGMYTRVTLQADIVNSGNTPSVTGDNLAVTFWDDDPNTPGANQIGETQYLDDLEGCGQYSTVTVDWLAPAGNHTWYVKVDSVTNEDKLDDNVQSESLTVTAGPAANTADMVVTKNVDKATPYTNQSVVYTIDVFNDGPDVANDIVVTDVLPEGVTFSSAVASHGSYNSTTGKWQVGTLANSTQAQLAITARVDTGQGGNTITNTATVTADVVDWWITNNKTGGIAITPIANADVRVTADLPRWSLPDTIANYEFVVTNNGPDIATSVTVTGVLSGTAMTIGGITTTQGTCSGTTALTCNLGNMNKDSSVTITIPVIGAALGNIDVMMGAEGTESDLISANDMVEDIVVIALEAPLTFTYLPLLLK